MRSRLDAIRHSAGEHLGLQQAWEMRLGKTFVLPEIKE
jgi:hypothetical protein